MSLVFTCRVCHSETEDPRTLRNSVCPPCVIAEEKREKENAQQRQETLAQRQNQRMLRDLVLDIAKVYEGALEDWRPGLPTLLPDRVHFICVRCRQQRSLYRDLEYLGPTVPDLDMHCDLCVRDHYDEIREARKRRRDEAKSRFAPGNLAQTELGSDTSG